MSALIVLGSLGAVLLGLWAWALCRMAGASDDGIVPPPRWRDPVIGVDQYTRERVHGLIELQKGQQPAVNHYTRDLLTRKD